MVVPLAVRAIVGAVGVLLIWTAARSMIGTVIVPRPVGSWLTRWVDKIVSFLDSLTGEQPQVTYPILPPSGPATPQPQP